MRRRIPRLTVHFRYTTSVVPCPRNASMPNQTPSHLACSRMMAVNSSCRPGTVSNSTMMASWPSRGISSPMLFGEMARTKEGRSDFTRAFRAAMDKTTPWKTQKGLAALSERSRTRGR